MPSIALSRPLRIVLVAAGVGLVLAALLAWLNRRTVARDALSAWLRGQGVASDIQVENVGPDTFVARVRLGDPARPDFVADRVTVRYRLALGGVTVRSVVLSGPVLRASVHQGRWSAGALDPLIRNILARPPQPGAPKPRIEIAGGRVLLASDFGPVDLVADATVAEGRLVRLSATSAPLRLKGPAFDVALGRGRLTADVQGGQVTVTVAAPVTSAAMGTTQLADVDVSAAARAPYPDLARPALDLPLSADLRLAGGSLRTAAATATLRAATLGLNGVVVGSLSDPAFRGRAASEVAAGRVVAGALTLADASGGGQGEIALGRRALTGAVTLRAAATGAWSGLGRPAAGDATEVAALKRAARRFDVSADAVALAFGAGGVTARLPRPVRFASDSGVRAELARRGGTPVLAPGGGALRLTLQGGGLPAADVDVARWDLTKGGASADVAAHVRGTLGVAEGADLMLAGRMTVAAGAVTLSAQRCATVSAAKLELGANDVEQVSARLCPAGGALFTARGGAWRLAGRAEAVEAAVPFLQARATGGAGSLRLDGRGGELSARGEVAALRVTDTAPQRRFNPIDLAGPVTLADHVWRADLAARLPAGAGLGRAHLVHDGGLGVGFVTLETGALRFAEGGLQPQDLSPAAAVLAPPVTGTASFEGRFDWARQGASGTGQLTLDGLDFQSAAGKVEGLSGRIDFASLAPLLTAPHQTLSIAKVDAIVPVTGIRAEVGVTAGALEVTGGVADVGGGQVRIETLSLPFAKDKPVAGVLRFDGVQLHDVVEASPFGDKVDLDARVSGRLPFTAGTPGVRIQGGTLKAVQPGRLSIQRTALTGISADSAVQGAAQPVDPNATFTDFAYQAMENLAFDTLEANVQSQADGRLGVLFHIVGRHDPPKRQEIRLSVLDLIKKRFLGRKLPLPSGTQVNLTLDTTLNLDDLLADYADFRRLHGSAQVQP